jgi:transcriptional regulator with XRE-family HTH domain
VTLTQKQKRVAAYLARGWTQASAAERVGVSPRTIRNWLTDVAGFKEAATDPAEAARDISVAETFQDLLTDPNPMVRARAVEIALKFPSDAFIQERTDAIQVVLHDLRGKRQPEEATA